VPEIVIAAVICSVPLILSFMAISPILDGEHNRRGDSLFIWLLLG
jgi:hypothetical protein